MKRPYILAILVVVFALAVFLAGANGDKQLKIQSKADHAERLWSTSAHGDKQAEAFKHWDEDGSIPTSCAKCHSTPGYKDYIGADGSAFNVVDSPAPLGTTVECEACHADPERGIVHDHTAVVFPSGVEVKDLGPEALCMECHQGRESTVSVDSSIASAGVSDDDTPSSRLRFRNVHYYASAATQFGTVVKGGYQYAGKSYDARFAHIPGYNACQVCHNPHSLEVELEACHTCHTGINDAKDIRYLGSLEDYDGDGNITEGVYYEIETLKEILYDTIRAYGRDVIGKPIAYDELAYPYFFNDNNDNGIVDSDEADSSNGYSSFSARLLRAAYNLQVAMKDPNSFAHNGKYMIELLYDSIEDLNSKLGGGTASAAFSRAQGSIRAQAGRTNRPLPRKGLEAATALPSESFESSGLNASSGHGSLRRTDEGHFDGSAEAWRHWDGEGEVPSTCAKCHSAEGLPYFIENGKNDVAAHISNGLLCSTCHTSPPHTRFTGPVKFPSGATVDLGDSSNLCLNCHQGRAAKSSVDSTISRGNPPYSFTNIHYYAAAASYFGHEVQGGYEFSGKSYNGRNIFTNHGGVFTNCVECHFGSKSFNRRQDDSDDIFHNASPSKEDCVLCHGQDIAQPHPGSDPDLFEFEGIRPAQTPDYDADGNTRESLESEIDGLEAALLAQIQVYGNSLGAPIAYDPVNYPYFFNDLNGNGVVDPDEADRSNGYAFNAPMLRVGYNYQLSIKEPCGYIHNPLYIAQLLVDSIEHLGGKVTKYTWR
ncbi:MAG: hypothetical protein WAU81_02930 [Candidatus Aminicenantales bacterium]